METKQDKAISYGLSFAWFTAWGSYIYWGWKLSDEAGSAAAATLWLATCTILATAQFALIYWQHHYNK